MEHFSEENLKETVSQALMSTDFKIITYKYEKVGFDLSAHMGTHYKISVQVMYSNSKHLLYFFAKCIPENPALRIFFIENDLLGKEAHFYHCIAPQLNKLLPSELLLPIPLCYFVRGQSQKTCTLHNCSDDGESLIVLEDLVAQGYCMPEEGIPLDLPHSKLVMKALAIFHGGSYLLQQPKKPQLLDTKDEDSDEPVTIDLHSIEESLFVGDEKHFGNRICRVTAEVTAAVMIKLWPSHFDKNNDYIKLVDSIWGYWQSVFEIVKTSSQYSNVICHGDPRFHNLMFAYEKDMNGKCTPIAVKLVDLELYRFAPPATDILFFIYVCTRRALRDQHLPELLSYYYNELVRVISPSIANYFMTKSSFQESVRQLKIFGVMIGMFLIPILMYKEDENVESASDKAVPKQNILELLLIDRSEQILKHINEHPEFKERVSEIYEEYLEFAGLWHKK